MRTFRNSIWSKDPSRLEDFLKNGADPNEPFSDGAMPLFSSIINGSEETTKLLLKYNADPNLNMQMGHEFKSAIYSATLFNLENTVYNLLVAGANFHKKCEDLNSAYDNAFMFNSFGIIDMFYRANKETLFTVVLVANRLSSEEDNPLTLPSEMWRHIVIQFSPIGIRIPF